MTSNFRKEEAFGGIILKFSRPSTNMHIGQILKSED